MSDCTARSSLRQGENEVCPILSHSLASPRDHGLERPLIEIRLNQRLSQRRGNMADDLADLSVIVRQPPADIWY
jgi:hypothetical protein